MRRPAVYIRWGPHRNRADDVALGLGAELIALRWQTKDWFRTPIRYVVQFFQTILVLLWRRPKVVISQHTQPFCSLAAWIYAKLTGAVLVTDCHNGPFVDRLWRRFPLGAINRFIYAHATLNLVHNNGIKQYARDELQLPGRFEVLHDAIPDVGPAGSSDEDVYVFVICSFSEDEPVRVLLEATALTPDVHYRITGNVQRLDAKLRADVGPNVRFTGFLSDRDYDTMLRNASVAMALSTRSNLLMRACHEVIAAGRPFITSEGPVAREYLSAGTLFAQNMPQSIADAVRDGLERRESLACKMAELRALRTRQWQDRIAEIRQALHLAEP